MLGGAPAQAQSSADAFFHEAAQAYVAGNLENARRAVERGLEVDPSDSRLQALRKKLEQQQNRQGGGSSSRQGGQNQSQNQQSRGQQSRQQRSGEAGDQTRPRAESPTEPQPSSSAGASGDRPDPSPQNPEAEGGQGDTGRRSTALSRAQAARLLRALERQEMKLLREVQARGQQSTTVEKDW